MLLFYRARLIIAPHGAGLSNIIFSKPGTTIIEVHCTNQIRVAFRLLSLRLGMRYYGTMTTAPGSLSPRCNKEGVTIDMNEFKRVLFSISQYLYEQMMYLNLQMLHSVILRIHVNASNFVEQTDPSVLLLVLMFIQFILKTGVFMISIHTIEDRFHLVPHFIFDCIQLL